MVMSEGVWSCGDSHGRGGIEYSFGCAGDARVYLDIGNTGLGLDIWVGCLDGDG